MSRLYLVLFLLLGNHSFAQNNLRKYLDFAKEQYDKGDYYYALEYYKKAMEIDSNTVEILWNYAETLRAYKDYRNAEKYYRIVYDREAAQIYPSSLLQLGLMQKQNGNYEAALETFKKAKKKYYKDKKSYLYEKSKREIESVLWAQSALRDTLNLRIESLPDIINSKNSEFGHGIYNNTLYFSSLRADSISEAEEVYTTAYSTNLYTSVRSDSNFSEPNPLKVLIAENFSSGNGTFSLDGKRFYFSRCSDEGYNYKCKIMVAFFSNGAWTNVDELGTIINEEGSNTTMPCIAEIEGKETLIFASDRAEGAGGLDLYYSEIKNGNQFGKVRPIKSVNSWDNEVTPWWDNRQKRLYFSSSWHNGFGGHDVLYSAYDGQFKTPENAGLPINSAANDLYYFNDADTCYVTSNRIGVNYSKNPTCCSDIFVLKPPLIILPPTPEETLADLNKRLPVTLYFHNDIPDPRSREKTTKVNYIESYNDYTAMIETYRNEYAKGLNGEKAEEAKEDIETFFIEYVDKGVSDLKLFQDLLLKELNNGAKIRITVKGFASPLAKTDYNVNLTKRRINSLVNYLQAYDNGVFAPYLNNTAPNGGRVVFNEVPFGEYTANQQTSDNPNDVQNSVYSRSAAKERKIEIQSVSYFTDGSEFPLYTASTVHDGGYVKPGSRITAVFVLKNRSDNPVSIKEISIPESGTTAEIDKKIIPPGESATVTMVLDTTGLSGFQVHSIYVSLNEIEEQLRLYITTQITN